MTNRDKIVKELINHESGVYLYFLCPYIPGEPGAHCKTGEEVDGQTFCRSCIEEWLDREIEKTEEDPEDYALKMLAAVPDIPDDECGKEFTAPCPCGGTIKAMNDSPLEIMNVTSEINTGKKECKVNLTLDPFEAGVVMGTLIFAMGKKPENEPVINPILEKLKAECMKFYEG